jgi:hypothetical protein
MRTTFGICLVTAIVATALTLAQSAAWGSCSCLKHAEDDAKRSAAELALRHLPSQSSFLTARLMLGQKLPVDAANSYITAARNVEQELLQAKDGKLAIPANLPVDAVSFLSERAVEIELEAARFLNQSQQHTDNALEFRELAFKHMLDFKDVESTDKCRIASELAREFAARGDHHKAEQYQALLLDEIQRTKGRYSPEMAEARAFSRHLNAQTSSQLAKH